LAGLSWEIAFKFHQEFLYSLYSPQVAGDANLDPVRLGGNNLDLASDGSAERVRDGAAEFIITEGLQQQVADLILERADDGVRSAFPGDHDCADIGLERSS